VRELHIDFLLEEEFAGNPSFLGQFLEIAGRADPEATILYVERSVPDMVGETDLLVIYTQAHAAGVSRVALLIEDKVRAGFQPRQAERYRCRGEAGIGKSWDQFWTCLVAPQLYFASAGTRGFDAGVSLERIKTLFSPNDSQRAMFKQQVVENAITKALTLGPQQTDDTVSRFRAEYHACFSSFFAKGFLAVTMTAPAPAWKGETWFRIKSHALPKRAYIMHKAPEGYVDLAFRDTDAARLKSAVPGLPLSQGMSVVQTGKSAAIRLCVEPITNFSSFELVRATVENALDCVASLLNWFIVNQKPIEHIMSLEPSKKPVPHAVSHSVGG
jgi:hypothetical protein